MARIPLIICFGDSLTAGYQSPSPENDNDGEATTPYGLFLQERLGHRATVTVSGTCGELTSDMTRRFEADVIAHAPGYVVILGGTNDLGWQTEPSVILKNLEAMYRRAMVAGIHPVAVTVPSIRPMLQAQGEGTGEARAWLADHLARRQALNRSIIGYCRAHDIACVDLFTVTSEPGAFLLAARYSNDGLHMTTEGYRRLADLLYDEVFASVFADEVSE